MAGLVLDLQTDAMNGAVRVSDLLRKAKTVSKKLRTPEIDEWIDRELKGYEKTADIPEYRRIHGHLRCYNPVQQRWMPLMVHGDPRIVEIYSSSPMPQMIGELESLVAGRESSTSLLRKFTPHQAQIIMDQMNDQFEPGLEISKSAVVAILDAVRTRVLDWALELESSGVLGEGMTFSPAEREAASQITHNHFTTNIGTMTGSQFQQGTVQSTQNIANGIDAQALTTLVDSIRSQLDEMHLGDELRAEMVAELDTLRAQAGSSKPKTGIIRESLTTVRHIIEAGAAHFLVAYGPQIATLLSTIPR
jgi:hypothetical protein